MPDLSISSSEPLPPAGALSIAKSEPLAQPSAMSRGFGAFWDGLGGPAVVNVVKALGGDTDAADKTVESVKGLVNGLKGEPARVWSELSDTGRAMVAGHLADATYHLAGAVPLVGAGAQRVGQEAEQGKWAEAAGHAGALILPFALAGAGAGGGESGAAEAAAKTAAAPGRAAAVLKAAKQGAAEQTDNALSGAILGGVLKGGEGIVAGGTLPLIRGAVKAAVKAYREFKPPAAAAAPGADLTSAAGQAAAAASRAYRESPPPDIPAAPPASYTRPTGLPNGMAPEYVGGETDPAAFEGNVRPQMAPQAPPNAAPVLPRPTTGVIGAPPATEVAPAVNGAPPSPEEMAAVFNPDKAVFEKAQAERQTRADVAKDRNHNVKAAVAGDQVAWANEMARRLYKSGQGISPDDLKMLGPEELDMVARNNGKSPLPPASKMPPEVLDYVRMKLRERWNSGLPASAPPIGYSGMAAVNQ